LHNLAVENPWWRSLWEKAGDAAFKAGDFPLAKKVYEKALDIGSLSDEGMIKLGEVYYQGGDDQAAEDIWLEFEGSGRALILLADLYEERGDIKAAVNTWEKYTSLPEEPTNTQRIFHYGLLLAAESPKDALSVLDQSQDEYPVAAKISSAINDSLSEELAYQYVISGQALAANDYWWLAAYAFEKAVILRPDYMEAKLYWGEALQHLAEPAQDALQILEDGIALDEEAPLANLFLGLYWQRQGSHHKALEYFEIAEQKWPDHPDIHVEKGKSTAALGDLETAMQYYQTAIELSPLNEIYYRQLADFCVLYAYQVRDTGLPAARFAVQLNDQDPSNSFTMGQVMLKLDDQMNAIQFFQSAIRLDPSFAPAHFQLGILYSVLNDPDLAVYYLEQVLIYSSNPALIDQAERLLTTYK
jgi:tetratricopeptide (TPR) repeat protein